MLVMKPGFLLLNPSALKIIISFKFFYVSLKYVKGVFLLTFAGTRRGRSASWRTRLARLLLALVKITNILLINQY
jgi:hypothetical protein